MIVHQYRISEKIRLSYIPTNKFKTGVLTFTLTLPLSRRNTALNQILPSVLKRGTERFPDMASINRRLDELYASCVEIRSSRFGRNLALVFTAEVLDQRYIPDETDVLGGVIDVIAQMLLHPKKTSCGFDCSVVEQELRFAADAIRSELNNTRSYSMIRLAEMMYRNEKDFPTMEESLADLSEIDGQILAEYHQRLLKESSLELFYIGSVSPEILEQKILSSFGDWEGQTKHALCLPRPEPSAGFLSKTETMPVAQGKLAMGFRTGVCATDSRIYTMLMLNELLGGSPASKLFLHVREELSLCYYCASAYNKNSGILSVSAGIESQNREKTERAILEQFEQLRQGNISESEWNAARISLENAYRQCDDNPFELQNFYGQRILFGIEGTIEDSRRNLAAVTKEDVIALARQIEYDTVFFIEGTLQGTPNEEDCDE